MGVTRTNVERWAWASLVANIVIILTGGLVRLTGSGLGCPTWPQCTEESFVPHRELGFHGVIEFGNRLLTYVLIAIAIGTVIAVWRWAETTPFARRLSIAMALGIPFQGVIGGITVLTELNPWVVALHLLLSMGLVIASTVLVAYIRGGSVAEVPLSTRRLVWLAYGLLLVAIYLGTVVTGSGPYAGDADAPRNGLNPETVSRIHALDVWTFVLVLLVVLWRLRATSARRRALAVLLAAAGQGLIGYVQYFTDLPMALVAAHLIGSAIVLALTTYLVLSVQPTRDRELTPAA